MAQGCMDSRTSVCQHSCDLSSTGTQLFGIFIADAHKEKVSVLK